MGEILLLKSINGHIITNQLVDKWLEANGAFVIRKTFAYDQFSVEITFVDEESTRTRNKTKKKTKLNFSFVQGAEMILDLLSTCYSDCISVSRPAPLVADSFENEDEERESSPVHLSSAMSTASKTSCFSRRLLPADNNMPIVGRGKGKENSPSPVPSVVESSKLLYFIEKMKSKEYICL